MEDKELLAEIDNAISAVCKKIQDSVAAGNYHDADTLSRSLALLANTRDKLERKEFC